MNPRRRRLLLQLRKTRPARNRQNRRDAPSQERARRLDREGRRLPPEDRLRRDHAHEPMPQMELVDAPEELVDERLWIEDELDQDFPRDVDSEGWGSPVELGGVVRVRARPGMRAAVAEVRPGLFVVGLMPDSALAGVTPQRQKGVATVNMFSQLVRALSPLMSRIPNGRGGRREPEEEEEADVGCNGRRCRCGR